MKKVIDILLISLLLSCSEKRRIEHSRDLNYLGEIVQTYMFECTDANQLEVHTKAKFNPTDTTMTFYIGKSKSDFFQKWNIPLNQISLKLDTINSTMAVPSLKIRGIENRSVIQYTGSENKISKKTKSFNIYLFDWCDKKKQDNFIRAFKRMIELAKLQE
ncbi:hypothetical protein [Sinomicrobium sp. M5D2P9]